VVKPYFAILCVFCALCVYIKSIAKAIATIDKSSIIVTVLIGKLKTSPKQAHLIFFLSKLLFMTPILLIPKTIIYALLNKPIPVYGTGENIRDWLYVEDNCEAIDLVLQKGKPGELYNIAANQELKNIQVVKTILKLTNKPESLIKFVKDRPGHDLRYSLNTEKIRELGWKPKTMFKDGIKKTLEWYKQNIEWWKPIIEKEQTDFYEEIQQRKENYLSKENT